MIEYIKLKNVGPAETLSIEPGSRLNILTGDNGLGKSFLLDIAWWILTGDWTKHPALPHEDKIRDSSIEYKTFYSATPTTSIYHKLSQTWYNDEAHRMKNGMVLYAGADGHYSFFDSIRIEYQKQEKNRKEKLPEILNFGPQEIWEGLQINGSTVCNGIIQDWVNWQFRKKKLFKIFSAVLERLSPSDDEILKPGKPKRIFIEDSREFPTLQLRYGTVAAPQLAASIRRIIEMAYLLVWAFNENKEISSLMHIQSARRLVLLIDEAETHLHPKWQRVFLPALLEAVKAMQPNLSIQMIVTTHSPLVTASIETFFDEATDRLFTFELMENSVKLNEIEWVKMGDAVGWLTSEVFGLTQARSREAEIAIEAAEAFMRNDYSSLPVNLKTKEKIHAELLRTLPGDDIFWPRWIISNQEVLK